MSCCFCRSLAVDYFLRLVAFVVATVWGWYDCFLPLLYTSIHKFPSSKRAVLGLQQQLPDDVGASHLGVGEPFLTPGVTEVELGVIQTKLV